MGREFIWQENINFLPWFGQAPSFPGYEEGRYPPEYRPFYGYPGFTSSAMPMYSGANVIQQPATIINGSHVSHIPTTYAGSTY
jgi:hypothetical protein